MRNIYLVYYLFWKNLLIEDFIFNGANEDIIIDIFLKEQINNKLNKAF